MHLKSQWSFSSASEPWLHFHFSSLSFFPSFLWSVCGHSQRCSELIPCFVLRDYYGRLGTMSFWELNLHQQTNILHALLRFQPCLLCFLFLLSSPNCIAPTKISKCRGSGASHISFHLRTKRKLSISMNRGTSWAHLRRAPGTLRLGGAVWPHSLSSEWREVGRRQLCRGSLRRHLWWQVSLRAHRPQTAELQK